MIISFPSLIVFGPALVLFYLFRRESNPARRWQCSQVLAISAILLGASLARTAAGGAPGSTCSFEVGAVIRAHR